MLTSKQRATLRGIASTYETIFQVGKYEFSDGEAIRDTVKTQLTLCSMGGIMSNHDVHCPFHSDHITSIVFHRYQRLTTI